MQNLQRNTARQWILYAAFALAYIFGSATSAWAEPEFLASSELSCEERLFLCHQEESRLEEEKRRCESDKRTCQRRADNCEDILGLCQDETERYRRLADECEAGLFSKPRHQKLGARLSPWGLDPEEDLAYRNQTLFPLDLDLGIGEEAGNVLCEGQLSICRVSVGIKEGELESCRDELAEMPCTQQLADCQVDIETCEVKRDYHKRRWLECRSLTSGR